MFTTNSPRVTTDKAESAGVRNHLKDGSGMAWDGSVLARGAGNDLGDVMRGMPFVSVDELAAELRASRRQIEQWCASGDIPAERTGGRWHVSPTWRTGLRGAVLAFLVGGDVVRAADAWT